MALPTGRHAAQTQRVCQSEPLAFLCLSAFDRFLGYRLTSWIELCLKFTSFDVTKGLPLGS